MTNSVAFPKRAGGVGGARYLKVNVYNLLMLGSFLFFSCRDHLWLKYNKVGPDTK